MNKHVLLTLLMGTFLPLMSMESTANEKLANYMALEHATLKYNWKRINLAQLEACIKEAQARGVNITGFLADKFFTSTIFLPHPEVVQLLLKYGAKIQGTRSQTRIEAFDYSLLEITRARKVELDEALMFCKQDPSGTGDMRYTLEELNDAQPRCEKIIEIFEKHEQKLHNQKHALMIRANDFLRQHAVSPYNQ